MPATGRKNGRMEVKLPQKRPADIEHDGNRAANMKSFRKSSIRISEYGQCIMCGSWRFHLVDGNARHREHVWRADTQYDAYRQSVVFRLLSSAVCVFLIQKENAVKMARIGAALLVAGMLTMLLLHAPSVQLGCTILIAVFMGVVNISILAPYIFLLNNMENRKLNINSRTELLLMFKDYTN